MLRYRLRRAPLLVFVCLVMGFLFVPVIVMVLFSFNGGSRVTPPLSGLSLSWYHLIFHDSLYTTALKNSAGVAAVTAVSTCVLGTMAVVAMAKSGPRVRGGMRVFFFAPIMLPALFIGLSLGTFFNAVHFSLWYPFSLRNVVAAHFLFAFPYFLLIAGAAFERLDPQLEETAADLGATPWQQFRLVTLPLVWIMLAAATLFVIALSFDEFVRTFFVIGAQSTVPMTLWSKFRISIDPSINALASLLLAVTVLGTLAAVLLTLGRGYMRRQLLRR